MAAQSDEENDFFGATGRSDKFPSTRYSFVYDSNQEEPFRGTM